METASQHGYLKQLLAEQIQIKPGFNPRKFFDDVEYRELANSIKAQGIIQPIIVRPMDDDVGKYWVVAGERRFRAAKEANVTLIPALVRKLNDQEAILLATLENTQRADMSPAEEAQAARDVLMGCGNDRQEAIKLLGWGQTKFESRLLLLHADASVLEALTERKIKLGHAELLSQLPSDFQIATLSKIIEHGYSVSELKTRLSDFALDLSKACFDISGCTGCPHNSALQASLFEDHINAGNCADRECHQAKSQAALQARKQVLSEQYPVIYFDTERPKYAYKVICRQGDGGVGTTQFEQGCRQCANFGALLMTSPDRFGQIIDDCCFELSCHKAKVDAYQATIRATLPKQTKNTTGKLKKSGNSQPEKAAAEATNEIAVNGEKPASASVVPGKVMEKIEAFYRELGAKTVHQNKLSVLCINTFALYRLVSGSASSSLWPDAIKDKAPIIVDLDVFLTLLSELDVNEIVSFNHRLLDHLLAHHEISSPTGNKVWAKGAAAAVVLTRVNLVEHFLLNKAFLGSFTKSGIEAVLRESINTKGERFTDYYESVGEKSPFAALMKKKNTEILAEVFSSGYDFTGFVPSCVSAYSCNDTSSNIKQGLPPEMTNDF